jgi:hypothetical protein
MPGLVTISRTVQLGSIFLYGSGDYVGQQQTFNFRHLIPQLQLSLLESLDLKLVEWNFRSDSGDHVIHVPMLGFQFLQLTFECFLVSRSVHCECPMLVTGGNSRASSDQLESLMRFQLIG